MKKFTELGLSKKGKRQLSSSENNMILLCILDGFGLREGGVLVDVAPTILDIMHQDQPQQIAGKSFIMRG